MQLNLSAHIYKLTHQNRQGVHAHLQQADVTWSQSLESAEHCGGF